MALQFVDRYSSTLSSSYTSGGGSLSVGSATNLPADGTTDFYLIVQAEGSNTEEVFHVTNKTGTTLTVTGAQANTTASNHASGAVVIGSIMSASAYATMKADNSQLLTVAQLDALTSPNNGDRVLLSNGLYEVIRIGGVWNYLYGGRIVTRPPSTGWSWDNQGSSTIDSTNGFEFMSSPANGATTNSARVRYRTAPATPYTLTVNILRQSVGSDGGFAGAGLFLRDGSSKLISFLAQSTPPQTVTGANPVAVAGGLQLDTATWTNSTTYLGTGASSQTWPSGNSFGSSFTSFFGNPLYLQVSDDGTNLIFRLSADGLHWTQFLSVSRTSFFASGPTQIGWGCNPINNPVDVALISWLAQ